MNFVKNKTLKLWILSKMRFSKNVIFFLIKCGIFPQCAMYVFLLAQVLLLLLNPARSLLIYSFCFFCKQLKFRRTSERISQLLPYCSWQIIDLFSLLKKPLFMCYNFSLFLCYLMHDAIIFSLRWHQIIEELPVCIWGKSAWVNKVGISDSKIENRIKTNGTLEEKHTTIISAFCLHKLDISNFFILKIKEKNRNRFIKEDQKMCEVWRDWRSKGFFFPFINWTSKGLDKIPWRLSFSDIL